LFQDDRSLPKRIVACRGTVGGLGRDPERSLKTVLACEEAGGVGRERVPQQCRGAARRLW